MKTKDKPSATSPIPKGKILEEIRSLEREMGKAMSGTFIVCVDGKKIKVTVLGR